jgi:Cu+-exporting ATPase
VTAAEANGVPLAEVSGFRATAGAGAEGQVLGDRVLVGTLQFLQKRGVASATASGRQNLELSVGVERAASISHVYVAVNEKLAGALALTDLMKDSTPEAVEALRKEGLRIVMLTGDRKESASMIAARLKISEVEAEVQPQQKSAIVTRLRQQGRIVAMAGDGINDAPALAAADVSIAMGTGADVAIESAGITLLKGDLRGIVRARKLSRATIRNIKQNLAFAFLYNVIGIPIAAGVFYPLFGWLLSPMLASAAMSFSSVSVIANALRLRRASL